MYLVVPELCPRSLPQYMTDNVCIQKNRVELYRAKMFFKFTKANDVVHFPRLDQPPHAVHAQLAFSETKEVALSSALVVMKQTIYKIGAGLTQVFGDTRLKTYEQYQFMYKEMMKQLKVRDAVQVNMIFVMVIFFFLNSDKPYIRNEYPQYKILNKISSIIWQ